MHFFLIFRSQTSGDCLYSSLSILFGNNGYMDELWVLCSIKLFMHPSYYCKHPCILLLTQTFEKAEAHFFPISIKNSSIDSDLKNEEAIKFEAQSNCKSKKWSSFSCVLALASVIRRNFFPIFMNVEVKCKPPPEINWFSQDHNVFQKFLFIFYFVN